MSPASTSCHSAIRIERHHLLLNVDGSPLFSLHSTRLIAEILCSAVHAVCPTSASSFTIPDCVDSNGLLSVEHQPQDSLQLWTRQTWMDCHCMEMQPYPGHLDAWMSCL